MFLLSLTLENLRAFGSQQQLVFTGPNGRLAQWTILIGDNNVGKSTTLEVIELLTTPFLHRLTDRRAGALFAEGLEQLQRDATSQPRLALRYGFGVGLDAVSTSQDAMLLTVEANVDVDAYEIGGYERRPDAIVIASYGTQRGDIFGVREWQPSRTALGTAAGYTYTNSPEEWFLAVDYNRRLSGGRLFEAYAEKLTAALIQLLPDVEDLRIEAPSKPGAGSPKVLARVGEHWVALDRLGSGYRSQVAWLVDFCRRLFERYGNSANPLAEPAICIVDEIDLHMHPKWQREIVGHLSKLFPNTQFIVSSHSPLIVQGAESANVVLLRREGDHAVIDNNPEHIGNWRVDQILTSDLFGLDSTRPPQTAKLLDERKRILQKPKRSKADMRRLDTLEAEIGDLPTASSSTDREAMEIIRQAAERLKSSA